MANGFNANDVNFPSSLDTVASSALAKKAGEQKVFIAGAAITLGGLASAERANLQLINPTGSGKNLFVFALSLYSTIAMQVKYVENATQGGTPVTITPRNLMIGSPATSVATASHSVTDSTGGTEWSNQSRITVDGPIILQLPPIIILPGNSLLIKGTVGDAHTFSANAYYFEE